MLMSFQLAQDKPMHIHIYRCLLEQQQQQQQHIVSSTKSNFLENKANSCMCVIVY